MIRKLLIANRGEIACRIIRTCRTLGIATVAVYSDVDKNALHVELADEAYALGGNSSSETYLRGDKLIQAAHATGADAIHPAYGFLAENAVFAQAVLDAGLTYVAPRPDAIERMGNKKAAKELLKGIPFVAGYIGNEQSDSVLIEAAQGIGFPIMVKAAAGGGGKGMRLVHDAASLPDALESARREALQAFGDATLMLEKALIKPRHIEVQVTGDTHGAVMVLGERECSIQRRHQKIIEECPAYGLAPELREAIQQAGLAVAQQLNYSSLGTVEFLLDTDGQFYFMEMNTRLQVEHPVTEAVYGVDLVEWQIRIAEGAHLSDLATEKPSPKGHAIEVRVYAEDPYQGFLPVTGQIVDWATPDGVRVDTGVRSGDVISPYYDPMIAKIIAHAPERLTAIRKLEYALSQTSLLGLRNNLGFLQRILSHSQYLACNVSTQFIDEYQELVQEDTSIPVVAVIAAALAQQGGISAWRNNAHRPSLLKFSAGESLFTVTMQQEAESAYAVTVNETAYAVEVSKAGQIRINGHVQRVKTVCQGADWWVQSAEGSYRLRWLDPLPVPQKSPVAEGSLRAPMHGQVIRVLVEVGQAVEKGAALLIMEAMKMEHVIRAPYEGMVETIRYQVGETVQADEVLLALLKT